MTPARNERTGISSFIHKRVLEAPDLEESASLPFTLIFVVAFATCVTGVATTTATGIPSDFFLVIVFCSLQSTHYTTDLTIVLC